MISRGFGRLFAISAQKDSKVMDMGVSEGAAWRWLFLWRQEEDRWAWGLDESRSFSVKSDYSLLAKECLHFDLVLALPSVLALPLALVLALPPMLAVVVEMGATLGATF
ncbi:hypothetical protein L195_g041707 [Trifolium pratense]|uniref:Uncharacterized protein n=1 Tax=Trifolium pratense TaxID=57577 RepID=A0A2K3M4C1_TRIPR|nr:hypothetical protein L195_g041707 [Trifolium pratense]